MIEDPFER